MLMPASSEFIALCRSQVALLNQGFGASMVAVYLTEQLVSGEEAKLVPIVAYPETSAALDKTSTLALLPARVDAILPPTAEVTKPAEALMKAAEVPRETREQATSVSSSSLVQQRQIVLPLIHEDVVLGFLVIGREDRAWSDWERSQIEQVAETLAIACVLDQRYQWSEQSQRQQRLIQTQQHDILDNLLHQFRNPLTALRTFGKLLLKRLLPEDNNREVAASIVRESDRLQELLQQFDQVIDVGNASLTSLTLPPANARQADAVSEASLIDIQPTLLLPASSFLAGSQLTLTPCSLIEVLAGMVNSAQAIAQEHRLTLQTTFPADLPLVQADAKALQEVFSNLVDNAIKYTPSGGMIWLEVGKLPVPQAAGFQAIAVSDNGLGIPAQDLKHIFERHYRGVQAETDISGSGLGLAIAQDLMQRMGGKIEVFSPALISDQQKAAAGNLERPGTSFVAWLPLAR